VADLRSGIPPASDTAYYQFLLKLGVIRAATWGERWDLWRSSQGIPFSSPIHTSPKVPLSGRLAEVRKKVPFLASASSDLDEAFDPTYDGDEESLVLSPLRPSPRKEIGHSRSLVGYTPSSSFDLDLLTLNPPIRTSTPVFGRPAHHGVTQTPPPYSVSEVDESRSFHLDENDSRLVDGLETPRVTVRNWLEEEPEPDELDQKVVWEMERRADDFYHTGVLGRCWDVWVQANGWLLVRSRLL
jgi:protein SFI1